MPQFYGPVYLHIVFSTKRRQPIIAPQLHTEFARFIVPILSNYKSRFITEGGTQDHLHLLIDLGRETTVATIMREIKSKSSAWLQKKTGKEFKWQAGYAVFSVSASDLDTVTQYIENQEVHHKKKTFQKEFEELLKAAGVEYDPKILWNDDGE